MIVFPNGKVIAISTHTLTWSVTNNQVFSIGGIANFNSHAHVERDNNQVFSIGGIANFNSHAHVERDLVYQFQ